MSNPSLAEEQLMELLLQLKKTTPDAARAILNSQPQIAYALITLMVNLNAINVDVLHRTLATHIQIAPTLSSVSFTSPSAPGIPGHVLAQYRTSTPPNANPPATTPPYPYPNGLQQLSSAHQMSGYGQTPPIPPTYSHGNTSPVAYPGYSQSYAAPSPPNQPTSAITALPEALVTISDDQKAVIIRVLSMTPAQINQLPPTERTNIIQLRTTLGLPPI